MKKNIMKTHFNLILVVLFFLTACKKEDDSPTYAVNNNPIVKTDATYTIRVDENVVYAKGLSHESLNSVQSTEMNLLLDVYYPDNTIENRPVYLFMHGGGFVGGSKSSGQIVDMAEYFAARGWVFISINYRVRDDLGTLPQEWIDYSSSLDAEIISQFFAMYPAHRDAKAALRWAVANANTYKINTDYITVGGGSAGAITSITLGVSNQEDYRDELNLSQDTTLSTSNLEQAYEIQSIIDFWGTKAGLNALELIYGHQRFDGNDPSLLIVHGTEDTSPKTPYSSALDLMDAYNSTGAYAALVPLEGWGHSAWDATVNGKSLSDLSFDFIVTQQNLNVE